MFKIIDYKTRRRVNPDSLVFTGNYAPWEILMDLDEVQNKIYPGTFRTTPLSVSKYLPFLPIRGYHNFVSLQEGATPLLASKNLGQKWGIDLYFKVEGKNPTGSFKDRGTAVEISVARELGAKGIAVASTGNMAASTSCYAAAARIPCFVFVPEDVPASKVAQVISYGGRIVQVKGNYNDAARLAEEVARKLGFYLAGDYAFRVEGAKTVAFEITEQLGWQSPDAIVLPMGCGTHLAACYKGFEEYNKTGFAKKTPQLFGVQAEGASAIVNSYEKGVSFIEPLKNVQTIASAIAVKDPLDGIKALDAIKSSQGAAMAVSDTEMLEGQYLLAKEEGLFTESSGGASLACIKKLVEQGKLKGKRVVCVLCGDGLKDPNSVLKVAVMPPTIHAKIENFLRLYENSFFEGRSVAFVDKEETIFTEKPSNQELCSRLQEVFATDFSEHYLEKIQNIIGQFLKKGKPITFSDLQDIVQDSLESLEDNRSTALIIRDFKVETSKDKKAKANVKVELEGDEFTAEAEGVGPVDALISSLRKACGTKLDFALTGYKVDIRSKGVNAVVYVEMKLVRNGTTSIGSGASPDIIQASIHAFEEAYNGLF